MHLPFDIAIITYSFIIIVITYNLTSSLTKNTNTPLQMSPPNTSLGKLNRMFIGTDKPIDIPWGIRDLVAGKHALTGPKSALVQILHSTFSQVIMLYW